MNKQEISLQSRKLVSQIQHVIKEHNIDEAWSLIKYIEHLGIYYDLFVNEDTDCRLFRRWYTLLELLSDDCLDDEYLEY